MAANGLTSWTVILASARQRHCTAALLALTVLGVAGCGGGGGGSSGTDGGATPPPQTAVTSLTLTAGPLSVAPGGRATLTWSTTNASSCAATGGWSGPRPTSGSEQTPALMTTTTFTMNCAGATGQVSRSATIEIAASATPALTFSADPTSVVAGGRTTLTWTSTGTTSCEAAGGWTGARATAGSTTTGPLNATADFMLNCSGPGGAVTRTVRVTVNALPPPPAPTLSFSASSTTVPNGEGVVLSWSSTNATACTAAGAWSGSKALAGTEQSTAITAQSVFSLGCSGPGGNVASAITIGILPSAPLVSLSVAPTRIVSGTPVTVSWSSTNANSCTGSGAWTGAFASTGSQIVTNLQADSSFLLSCSGAGGVGHAVAAVEVLSDQSATMVLFASTVPSAARTRITAIVSAQDESQPGQAIAAQDLLADGGSLLFATDASDDFLLAGFASSSSTELSATSTALAISRIALGPSVGGGVNSSQINHWILASTEFTALVAAVQAALDGGTSPLRSAGVTEPLNRLLSSIAPLVGEMLARPSYATAKSEAGGIVSHAIKDLRNPLPAPIVHSTARQVVYVRNSTADNGVDVVNRSSIAWGIGSSTNALIVGDIQGERTVGGSAPLSSIVREPTPTSVRGRAPQYFVRARQTPDSRLQNVVSVVVDFVNTAADLAGGIGRLDGSCVYRSVNLFAQTNTSLFAFFTSMQSRDPRDVSEQLLAALRISLPAIAGFVLDCGSRSAVSVRFLRNLLGPFRLVLDGVAVGSTALTAVELLNYYDTDEAVRICQAGSEIFNCATRLVMSGDLASPTAGGSSVVTLEALDSEGERTLLRGPIEWSSSDTSIMSVESSSTTVGANTLHSIREGNVTITATDSFSSLSVSTRLAVQRAAYSVFRYTGFPMISEGISPPVAVPGPMSLAVTIRTPVAPDFTGIVYGDGIARVVLSSSGLGNADLTGAELFNAIGARASITFTNGAITNWFLSTGLLNTGVSCTAAVASPSFPEVSGSRFILLQGESGIYGDQAFDRCIGLDRFGREHNRTTVYGLNRDTDPANWHGVTVVAGPPIALQIRPRPLAFKLATGTSRTLTVLAIDAEGNVVPLPLDLQWTSSSVATATVGGGVVTAIAPGFSDISVRDPVSGASDTMRLEVKGPIVGARYRSAVLLPSGDTPAPGAVEVELTFDSELPAFYTGTIGRSQIRRARFLSAGVGVVDILGAELPLVPGQTVSFANGEVYQWSLGTGLVETGMVCVAREATPEVPTIMGTRSIALASGNALGAGNQVNDTAFDRCIGSDPSWGTFSSHSIWGAASAEPQNWTSVRR